MKDYSNKYKYNVYTTRSGKQVVSAMSTYEGKIVKGVAKCDPGDTFDEATGKKLAAARCNERISAKRQARAAKKLAEANKRLAEAQVYLMNMTDYYNDSVAASKAAAADVQNILNSL